MEECAIGDSSVRLDLVGLDTLKIRCPDIYEAINECCALSIIYPPNLDVMLSIPLLRRFERRFNKWRLPIRNKKARTI